jgi:hypothetical protein
MTDYRVVVVAFFLQSCCCFFFFLLFFSFLSFFLYYYYFLSILLLHYSLNGNSLSILWMSCVMPPKSLICYVISRKIYPLGGLWYFLCEPLLNQICALFPAPCATTFPHNLPPISSSPSHHLLVNFLCILIDLT